MNTLKIGPGHKNGLQLRRAFSSVITVLWCILGANAQAATQVVYWGSNAGETNVPVTATNIVALAGGDNHVLALRADGTVLAWGMQGKQTSVPPDLTNAVAIAAGSSHSLALLDDGTVRFWGIIGSSGVSNLPPVLAGEVVGLALGSSAQHILATRADGSVVDCGNTNYGLPNIPEGATNVVGVAVGSYYSVALRADGQVVAWGQFYPSGSPAPPYNLTNVVAVAGGINEILALTGKGSLVEWPGVGSIPAAASNIVAIACGGYHSLALRNDGKLFAWGQDSYGQTDLPPNLTNVVGIAATTGGSLALTAGDGPPLLARPLANPAVVGTTVRLRVAAISTTPLSYQWFYKGAEVTGATTSALSLTNIQPDQAGAYCVVVSNAYGMATNALNLQLVPLAMTVQPESQAALVGASVSLNVAALGQAPLNYQWQFNGTNLPGATASVLALTNLQLADAGPYSATVTNSLGGTVSSNALLSVVPLFIIGQTQDPSSFPGGTATMSIQVQCNLPLAYQWQFNGANLTGATGASLTLSNLQYTQAGVYNIDLNTALTNVTSSLNLNITPVANWGQANFGEGNVTWGLTNISAIACGDYHRLALKTDGTVVGWGHNVWGEATPPPTLTNPLAIAAGNGFSMALQPDGNVVAWGHNSHGECNVPPGLANVVAIVAGDSHALALRTDGTVVAWGDNSYGQTNLPPGLSNILAISAGEWHSLALTANGTVIAWGAGTNNTEVDPFLGQSMVPAGLTNVVAVAAGGSFSLALKADGTVVGWGDNDFRELTTPKGLSNLVAIAAGFIHSLALRADGSVVSWGYNDYGQTNVPAGLMNVSAIAARGYGSVAVIGGGPPALSIPITHPAWGANGFTFSFPSHSGRIYRIEYKNSLADNDWTPLPLVPGNGRIITAVDPTAAGRQRFYRIRGW